MSTINFSAAEWAEQQFGSCILGDARRTRRLVMLAEQVAGNPSGSTPDQTESWGDLKAAYRLFDQDDVTFDAIIAPHCQQTLTNCQADSVKLIINDTTEIDFGLHRKVEGLKPTGNGFGRGFFLHSALMVDAESGKVEGLAGQKIFYREPRTKAEKKKPHNTRRRQGSAESQVWRNQFEDVGQPPSLVKWIHVCDRGADDYEVYCQAQRQKCGFVVRAARLNRKVLDTDGQKLPLTELLDALPAQGTRAVAVLATTKSPARTAEVTLRFGSLLMPWPSVVTKWMREHSTKDQPIKMNVVELREMNPPKGAQAIRWVLFTSEAAQWVVQANGVIEHYEQRPIVEEYHKALKTGCSIEERRYETAERLERVLGLLSVTAVRLLQMKTAALETPDRPARDLVPSSWIKMLQCIRRQPLDPDMTIDAFVRLLAKLGGHLGRKGDGRPGWITLWRGVEKLILILRGAAAASKRCG